MRTMGGSGKSAGNAEVPSSSGTHCDALMRDAQQRVPMPYAEYLASPRHRGRSGEERPLPSVPPEVTLWVLNAFAAWADALKAAIRSGQHVLRVERTLHLRLEAVDAGRILPCHIAIYDFPEMLPIDRQCRGQSGTKRCRRWGVKLASGSVGSDI
jgi:hypothetical protein